MKKYTISMIVLALAFFGYACSDDNNDSAEINVSDTVVDFGDVAAGTSASVTITVTNQGDVTLDDIAIGIESDAFSADPLEFSLNVGGSQDVTLTFAPETQGDFSAEANISAVSQNLFTTVNLAGFATDELVGSWVSEGEDVAPGLQILTNTVRVDATFNSDDTYVVVSEDTDGATVNFTGTWQAGEANAEGIRPITLNQSEPVAIVASGIFRINDGRMEYEVIQEEPSIGAIPPNAEDGFGSTIVEGDQTGPLWIQYFNRVEE